VEEETGLKAVTLVDFITTTWHTYVEFGKHILKESHWYRMNASSNQALVPQAEEGIIKLEWSKKADLKKYLANTFPSIKEVLGSL
jgi:NUDIX domain